MARVVLSEIFASIQGEGPYVGLPAAFVRLAGCNLRCPKCDTKYAWEGREVDVAEVVDKVRSLNVKTVIYTGGEPLLQPEALEEIASSLYGRVARQMIETNATIVPKNLRKLTRLIKVWVLSPKLPSMNPKYDMALFRNFLEEVVKHDVELYVKFVVGNRVEVEIADTLYHLLLKDHLEPTEVVLQPLDGGEISYRQLIEESLRLGLEFRVLPQLHKVVGVK